MLFVPSSSALDGYPKLRMAVNLFKKIFSSIISVLKEKKSYFLPSIRKKSLSLKIEDLSVMLTCFEEKK